MLPTLQATTFSADGKYFATGAHPLHTRGIFFFSPLKTKKIQLLARPGVIQKLLYHLPGNRSGFGVALINTLMVILTLTI